MLFCSNSGNSCGLLKKGCPDIVNDVMHYQVLLLINIMSKQFMNVPSQDISQKLVLRHCACISTWERPFKILKQRIVYKDFDR